MGRILEQLQIKGVKNGTSSLNVKYHYRGGDKGKTDFEVYDDANGNKYSFNLNTPEEALQLAKYLEEQVNHTPIAPYPSFETTGYALRIYCAGRLIRTVYELPNHKNDLDSFSYASIKKSFPEFNTDDYFYVIYCLRDTSLTRATIETIIDTCIQHQSAVLTSGDLRTCKPMIQKDIADKTRFDISTISRSVKDTRIFTSHRIFSLDNIQGPLSSVISLFNEGVKNNKGETVSSIGIREKIFALIETEDPSRPYTDEQISVKLSPYGYNIARRTVTKYREQLGLPKSHVRRVK